MFRKKTSHASFFESNGSRIDQDYQRLKANISFAASKNNSKIFSVLSSNKQDGKTDFLVYIGLSFCKDNKKILLIDGDFKKPELHNVFNLSNEVGLSNYLTGETNFTNCIQRTEYAGLSVLTAGTISKQMESVVQGSHMSTLINSLRRSYDYIFIDTEALKESTVAKLMAAKADSSIVIIRNKKTTTEDLLSIKNIIKSYEIHLTGAVNNTRKLAWLQK